MDPIWNLGLALDSLARRKRNLAQVSITFLVARKKIAQQVSISRNHKTYRNAFAGDLLSTVNDFLQKRLSNIIELRASIVLQVEPPSVLPSRTLQPNILSHLQNVFDNPDSFFLYFLSWLVEYHHYKYWKRARVVTYLMTIPIKNVNNLSSKQHVFLKNYLS